MFEALPHPKKHTWNLNQVLHEVVTIEVLLTALEVTDVQSAHDTEFDGLKNVILPVIGIFKVRIQVVVYPLILHSNASHFNHFRSAKFGEI